MKMLRLPMDVMISGMEAMTNTVLDIHRKAGSHDWPPSGSESDNASAEPPSMFGNAMNRVFTPLFEMYKIPVSGLLSGFETLANAIGEMRNGPAVVSGTDDEARRYSEAVPLTEGEAAMERSAWLAEGLEETAKAPLWQIGRPGRQEYAAKWKDSFDYAVGQDTDPLNNPRLPHLLTVPGGPKSDGATEKLNLLFALDRDYEGGELALIYDRWGGEKDQVYIDHELLAPVQGQGGGRLRHVALSLGCISRGDHVVTITTSGDTKEQEHRIDYLKLTRVDTSASTD